jgi:hypothetical protein
VRKFEAIRRLIRGAYAGSKFQLPGTGQPNQLMLSSEHAASRAARDRAAIVP